MRQSRIVNFRPKEAKFIKIFHNTGSTFSAYYAAETWIRNNGFSSGSTECGISPYVAIQKGEYTLPNKLHNFSKIDIEMMDGVIYSRDYRDEDIEIRIYNEFKEAKQ